MRGAQDQELITALGGDGWAPALGELWQRHLGLLWNTARAVTRTDDDAADAIGDAFANLAARAADGRLRVTQSFRALAVTAVRNAAIDRYRKTRRDEVTDTPIDAGDADTAALPVDRFVSSTENAMVAAAFASLPERSRTVLWLTAVEGLAPREVAAITGLSANNVAQIASRSRDALRAAWVDQHLTHRATRTECAHAQQQLPASITGRLGVAAQDQLDAHLAGCADCSSVRNELTEDTLALRGLITLPLAALSAGGGWIAKIPAASKHRARHLRHARRAAKFGPVGGHPVASTIAAVIVATVVATGVVIRQPDSEATPKVGVAGTGVGTTIPPSTTVPPTSTTSTPRDPDGNTGGSDTGTKGTSGGTGGGSGLSGEVHCSNGTIVPIDHEPTAAELSKLCGTGGGTMALRCPNGQIIDLDYTPTAEQMLQLCGMSTGSTSSPTTTTTAPPPSGPVTITAVIPYDGDPNSQTSNTRISGDLFGDPYALECTATLYYQLSDGRVVSEAYPVPMTGADYWTNSYGARLYRAHLTVTTSPTYGPLPTTMRIEHSMSIYGWYAHTCTLGIPEWRCSDGTTIPDVVGYPHYTGWYHGMTCSPQYA